MHAMKKLQRLLLVSAIIALVPVAAALGPDSTRDRVKNYRPISPPKATPGGPPVVPPIAPPMQGARGGKTPFVPPKRG